MKELSIPKARKLITEETNTAKEYKQYGFKKQGNQEAQHANFFKKYIKVKSHLKKVGKGHYRDPRYSRKEIEKMYEMV